MAYNVLLKSVDFTSAITINSMSNCITLRTVKIPSSVTSITTNAFRGCTALEYVDMTDWTVDDINNCSFGTGIFSNATTYLNIMFATQEVMEAAKVKTNLTAFASYMHYVGE